MASKKTRPSLSARASFFLHLQSIAVADIDRAVGAPFPAAVINVEMMAMAVMTMPMMVMTMTMTMPVVPVMAVASVPTVTATASESLTRDGEGSRGQCQSSDCGRNDLPDLRHGRLLSWAKRGSLCDDPSLKATAAMRCDQGHPTGRITQLV
jgi:hypothetical protein